MAETCRCYLIALAACIVQTCVFGVMNSFTVFLHKMTEDDSLGNPSQTDISFGNGVALGLSPVVGFVAGRLVDKFDSRILLCLSAASLSTGLLLCSYFAHSAVEVSVYFSIPIALASGLMLSPGSAAAMSWFDEHSSLASGIVFAGGGVGSCFVPFVASSLNDAYSWREAFRFLSLFGVLCFGAAATIKMNRRDHEKPLVQVDASVEDATALLSQPESVWSLLQRRPLTQREAFTVYFHRDFQVLFWAFAFFTWSFYGILYLVVPYASSMGKEGTVYSSDEPISTTRASTLFTPFGIVQVAGSILTGYFAVKINDKLCFVFCAGFGAVLMALLALCRTYTSFAIVLGLLGFPSAGAFAVVPPLIAKSFPGPNVGLFIGSVFSAAAFGGFSAAPIISSIQSSSNHDYTTAVALVGISWAISGLLVQFGCRSK